MEPPTHNQHWRQTSPLKSQACTQNKMTFVPTLIQLQLAPHCCFPMVTGMGGHLLPPPSLPHFSRPQAENPLEASTPSSDGLQEGSASLHRLKPCPVCLLVGFSPIYLFDAYLLLANYCHMVPGRRVASVSVRSYFSANANFLCVHLS